MARSLKRAAKEAGLALDGWDLSDLEAALHKQALRLVQFVDEAEIDDSDGDAMSSQHAGRLLEKASLILGSLAESKAKRVKATETLMRIDEIRHKISRKDIQHTNTIVLTPGEDAREMVFDVMLGRAPALLPPAPPQAADGEADETQD